KYRAANHEPNDIRSVRGVNIVEEAIRIIRRAPQSESEYHRNQEDADCVVPIEQLEPIVLDAFVCVCPRSPADGAGDHHDQRNVQTMRCIHLLSLSGWRSPGGQSYLPRILETKSCRKRSASTSIQTFALGNTLSTPSIT